MLTGEIKEGDVSKRLCPFPAWDRGHTLRVCSCVWSGPSND